MYFIVAGYTATSRLLHVVPLLDATASHEIDKLLSHLRNDLTNDVNNNNNNNNNSTKPSPLLLLRLNALLKLTYTYQLVRDNVDLDFIMTVGQMQQEECKSIAKKLIEQVRKERNTDTQTHTHTYPSKHTTH